MPLKHTHDNCDNCRAQVGLFVCCQATAVQDRVVNKVVELAEADSWLALSAMAGDALRTARELREVEPQWAGVIYVCIGNCYESLGQYAKAMELFRGRGRRSTASANATSRSVSTPRRWSCSSRPWS